MATTNFVRAWEDGDRLFVNVNGATIEVHSFTFNDGNVTLQFHARVDPVKHGAVASGAARRLGRVVHQTP